jgi:hypothetical protein
MGTRSTADTVPHPAISRWLQSKRCAPYTDLIFSDANAREIARPRTGGTASGGVGGGKSGGKSGLGDAS